MPKFSKFAGELEESIVEHVTHFQTECCDLAIDAFTWFTTLPPNSIYTCATLKGVFHKHFFRGETKVSLINLATIKHFNSETI